MKYSKKRLALACFWVLLAVSLIAFALMGMIDVYWISMGGGFLGVGISQLVRLYRYKKDRKYRESVDIRDSDERNRFLVSKAWSAAAVTYIVLNGIAVIVLRILGYYMYSQWAAWNGCILLVLYWLCWLWASKKY